MPQHRSGNFAIRQWVQLPSILISYCWLDTLKLILSMPTFRCCIQISKSLLKFAKPRIVSSNFTCAVHLTESRHPKRWLSLKGSAPLGKDGIRESTDRQEIEHHNILDIDYDFEEDGDDGDNRITPWRTILEAPARASWRATSHTDLPSSLLETQQKILKEGGRTSKQLNRALRGILASHDALAQRREVERRRMVNGKPQRDSNNDSVDPVYYGPEQTLASVKHRLIPNFAVCRRVLQECQSLLGMSLAPKRVIDFGMGCGSASAAALDLFNGIEWIHGIDPSKTMRLCSQMLVEGVARENVPRLTFSRSLSADTTASNASSSTGFDIALCAYTSAELTSVSSSLAAAAILFQKLKPNGLLVIIEPGTPDGFNAIRAARNMLLDCCPPEDPDFEWAERCHVIAPCTHNGSCPMERHKKQFYKSKNRLQNPAASEIVNSEYDTAIETADSVMGWDEEFEYDDDSDVIELSSHHGLMSETDAFSSSFCSFVHTMPDAGSKRNGEKFSYLVVQKRIFDSTEDRREQQTNTFKRDSNVAEMLARAFDASYQGNDESIQNTFHEVKDIESRYLDSDGDDLGLELIRGDSNRNAHGRIIRAPIKKRGHVYIDYCAEPGRIIRSRVTKAMSNAAPGLFAAARKSRWGGLWPDTMERIYSKDDVKY